MAFIKIKIHDWKSAANEQVLFLYYLCNWMSYISSTRAATSLTLNSTSYGIATACLMVALKIPGSNPAASNGCVYDSHCDIWPWVWLLTNKLHDSCNGYGYDDSTANIDVGTILLLFSQSFFWTYRVSQKSNPPKVLINILASAKPFWAKFRSVIGNLYPHMCTKFGEFVKI